MAKRFGVECSLGHWIPKSAVVDDEGNNERFLEFEAAMLVKLYSRMNGILGVIMQACALLTQDGIVDATDAEPTQAFQQKAEALRNDDVQLCRIWSGRHFSTFPTISGMSTRQGERLTISWTPPGGARKKT